MIDFALRLAFITKFVVGEIYPRLLEFLPEFRVPVEPSSESLELAYWSNFQEMKYYRKLAVSPVSSLITMLKTFTAYFQKI